MISERLYRARLAAGLTLAGLAQRVGLSHTAIQKFEHGKLTPSSSQLLKIARACGVRTEYFFRVSQVELVQPEFRKHKVFSKKSQEALKLKTLELIERRVELLMAFPDPPMPVFVVPNLPANGIAALEDIEQFAVDIRNAWQLGMNPISDLTDTLESLGLLVVLVPEDSPHFYGFSALANLSDGSQYPVIAVSERSPGDRQRFTLAHELGHFLLARRLPSGIDEERACDRFAAAFLVPPVAVSQQLGKQRNEIEWQELYALKHEFGLSMAGWLQRAKQCDVLTAPAYLSAVRRFSGKGWHKQEPGEPLPREHPRLFKQLVYRALAQHYISESKAAELLGIPLVQFYRERQLEVINASSDQ